MLVKNHFLASKREVSIRKDWQLCWLPVSARLSAELVHGVTEAADDVVQTNLGGGVVMVELGVGCDTLLKAGYSTPH